MSTLRPVVVTIDGVRGFDALVEEGRWNGWLKPYFTLDEAMRVAEMHSGVYEPENDQFVFNDEGDEDVFVALHVEGERRYAIGAGSWTWDELIGDHSVRHKDGCGYVEKKAKCDCGAILVVGPDDLQVVEVEDWDMDPRYRIFIVRERRGGGKVGFIGAEMASLVSWWLKHHATKEFKKRKEHHE